MSRSNHPSLWHALDAAGASSAGGLMSAGRLVGVNTDLAYSKLTACSALSGRTAELKDRSVLILAKDQFTAALALIELDGIARRIVLYPPELSHDHLPYVTRSADVDAIVADAETIAEDGAGFPDGLLVVPASQSLSLGACDRTQPIPTEWVLLTSGTTGLPKMVQHTLESLGGGILHETSAPSATSSNSAVSSPVIWSTFYDIRRYGGMQIFLRAILTGSSLVLSGPGEPTAVFLTRAGNTPVTHISGTPSHWRRTLMSPAANRIEPRYIRLSGEVADQGILNALHSKYPTAAIGHAFATTEAGVAFAVNDAHAGFPAAIVENTPGVEMQVVDRTLRIRSARTATRYLGDNTPTLKDEYGFVDTGDVVEQRDGRYYFLGRRDGIINVGGLKVYPEEVEAVINRHPAVQVSLVRTKKNPITGNLVVADVVLKPTPTPLDGQAVELKISILTLCRKTLSSHKVPMLINFVPSLAISETGKLIRQHA